MLNLQDIAGKKLTLWLTNEEEESAVFAGVAVLQGDSLFFKREGAELEILTEWYPRLTRVEDDESKEILLGADYYLRLSIGKQPTDSEEVFVKTGLRWPED